MKYIVYCRKSTDEKDRQILSIEAQIAELTEISKREGLEIVEFVTEAKTAKVPGRELFGEMLEKIEKGKADGIISWHPDRLARNSIDGGKIIYLLDLGLLKDIKFPQYWFENTPQGKFMLSIAFSQSKYYIDNLSENVKRGLRQKLRNGVYPGKAFWGYSNNEKTGNIDIDPVESKIVKKAFQLFAEGNKSFTDIGKFLHKHGISQKDGSKSLKIDLVKQILSNKFYIGIIFYVGEYYEGKQELFISKQLFDKVQRQIKITERSKSNNKHHFSFLGLMKCGECGASITAEKKLKFYKNTRGTVEYIYYRCTKKLKPCTQKYIQEPELEKQIRKTISDVAIPEGWGNKWYKWLERDELLEKQTKDENITTHEEELKTLETKLNLLLDSYLDNVIDADTYKKKKNELFEEKLKKEEGITRIQTNGSSWLGPMREFVDSSLGLTKIARAKNTCEEIAFFAKTVGSDFFLTNRQLKTNYNLGFATIYSDMKAFSASPKHFTDSDNERVKRIELS